MPISCVESGGGAFIERINTSDISSESVGLKRKPEEAVESGGNVEAF
jgi:hypothetical protein